MTAKEFQQSAYFDNILISTIRFLDELPAKTPNEKSQFMRGLTRVLSQFPSKVLEKKVLPALLEEMKDRELLSLILQNVFKIINALPNGRRPFAEKIIPRLREIFLPPNNIKSASERDPAKEAGLMVLLENMTQITKNCSGKEFKDGETSTFRKSITLIIVADILPIVELAIESPTHTIVDAALKNLPIILPVLDFSTIKNELFPVIASVFSKTNSLGIKVRGLEAFVVLCGGSNDPAASNDGLDGIMNSTANKKSSSTALDKYTMQEKILPLIKGIKTKEPAVGIAALNVLRQVGGVADAEFVAMDILPVLWSMSLGPLLNLKQFQSFMELIKSLSTRVETEQTKKLQELSGVNATSPNVNDDFMSFGAANAFQMSNGGSDNAEIDFEQLVKGKAATTSMSSPMDAGWDAMPANATTQPARSMSSQPKPAAFSWSTPSPTTQNFSGNPGNLGNTTSALRPQQAPVSRTITPDLSRFDSLTPSTTQFSQPLQPQTTYNAPSQPQANYNMPALQPQTNYNTPIQPPTNYNPPQPQSQPFQSYQTPSTSVNWGAAAAVNPWGSNNITAQNPSLSSMSTLGNSMSSLSMNQRPAAINSNSFSIPSPNQRPAMNNSNSFSLPPPPGTSTINTFKSTPSAFGQAKPQPPKSGLDAYESLL